ncbi:hypothetical protein [Paenibacillus terrae]|uniref:Uncharacterized protein n=1 Tax=Paenibacillus terrae TaxID=159743 RepID=A0A0D7WSZ0_9BACL|nr:hypothetical protein [Paenibacillus terrae]KJD42265.1 hypothetical protein QD47_29235 [Paenibacillus terrae]
MEFIITFTDPKHTAPIEDVLERSDYIFQIIHTPLELLDINVFFCKTALMVTNGNLLLLELISEVPEASLFCNQNSQYEFVYAVQEGV